MRKIQITGFIFKDVIKATPGSLAVTAITYLLMALTPSAQVLLLADLFDEIHGAFWYQAGITAFWFLLSMLIYSLSQFVYSIAMNAGLYEKTNAYFKVKLYTKMAQLPFIALEDPDILSMKERAENAIDDEVLPSVLHKLLTLCQAIVTMISVSIVLVGYSPWLFVVPILSVIPYLVIRLIRGKEFYNMKYFQSDKRRLQEYLYGLFSTGNTVREMRTLGFGGYLENRFTKVHQEVEEETRKFEEREVSSVLICDVIKTTGYGASAILILCLLGIGSITVGAFGACLRTVLQMQESFLSLFTELGKLPRQYALAEDFYHLFDLPDVKESSGTFSFEDQIRMEDISFTYPGVDTPALSHVSLTIPKGKTIAIVGENGSGKTTLSRVLMGMYPPSSGKLTYDGAELTSPWQLFSVVAQDFVKYQDTVEGNIAIARQGDAADIPAFLQENNLCDTVDKIGGLSKMLGNEFDGQELSGGQWQQLAILRGFYKESPLLVLDEPTASLDPITEYEVLQRFLTLSRGRTSILVSHRIGICSKVDSVIVMDKGRIVEFGSHTELMDKRGLYHRMFTAQQMWYSK